MGNKKAHRRDRSPRIMRKEERTMSGASREWTPWSAPVRRVPAVVSSLSPGTLMKISGVCPGSQPRVTPETLPAAAWPTPPSA
jgi:hypothetical protein